MWIHFDDRLKYRRTLLSREMGDDWYELSDKIMYISYCCFLQRTEQPVLPLSPNIFTTAYPLYACFFFFKFHLFNEIFCFCGRQISLPCLRESAIFNQLNSLQYRTQFLSEFLLCLSRLCVSLQWSSTFEFLTKLLYGFFPRLVRGFQITALRR